MTSLHYYLTVVNAYCLFHSQMLAPFSLMCVKMIVSMVVSDVDAGRALVPVQIVAIVPTASAGKLSDDVPAHVMLPRSVQ